MELEAPDRVSLRFHFKEVGMTHTSSVGKDAIERRLGLIHHFYMRNSIARGVWTPSDFPDHSPDFPDHLPDLKDQGVENLSASIQKVALFGFSFLLQCLHL